MIRDAKTEDIQSISEIIVSAWQTAFSNIIDPEYPKSLEISRYKKVLTENLTLKKEKIFVFDDGAIKGFISGKDSDSKYDCEVVGLYVHPDYQQEGIGQALLREIKAYFKDQGHRNVIIWTLKDAYNNAFYTKEGGVPLESKEFVLGQKTYQGVGFIFNLETADSP